MSWFSKISVLGVFISVAAFADRYYFTSGTAARLDTQLTVSNSIFPPLDVEFTLPFIDVDRDVDGFHQISTSGLVPIDIPGNPELFSTGTLLAVPEGIEPRIQVLREETREIANVLVRPAQRKFRCATRIKESFTFHSHLYRSNGIYPANSYLLEEVGKIQGVRLVRLGITPIRQNFGNSSLSVTHYLKLRVSFETGPGTTRPGMTQTFYRLVRQIAANGPSLGNGVTVSHVRETFLIFAADSLQSGLTKLINWKREKGFNVEVFSLTQAGGTKEKLLEYIKNYYNTHNPKPTYLLFVGNGTTMPPYFESTASGSAASDYRFSLLTGNDAIPDLLYGRIVADNLDELALQVNRWIEYEKTPQRESWYKSATTIASNEGANPSDKDYAKMIEDALRKYTYIDVDQFYQGEGTATSGNILKGAKEGRSWLAYFGHGSGTSWGSTNDTFDNTTVSGLENEGRLPVLIDVACLNAAYTNLSKCFGKAWVTQQHNGKNAGAVAFYGGSVSISWHPPAVMSVGIAKYHFEKPVYSVGASVLAGQLYLIEKMGLTSATIDNLEWYNLFGDPSLLMRTDAPKVYSVKTRIAESSDRVTLTVTATDSNGKSVPNLLASLKAEASDTPLATEATNDLGVAILEVPGMSTLEPNTLLTVTGYNTETYQAVVN